MKRILMVLGLMVVMSGVMFGASTETAINLLVTPVVTLQLTAGPTYYDFGSVDVDRSTASTSALVLTNGLASPNQYLYLIREDTPDAPHVGYLWWGVREQHGVRTAVLYFVGILEPYRRRGYATQALRLLERDVADRGLQAVRLYVFGHNTGAWALYEKMGYAAVSLTMAKRVEQA